MEGMGISEVVPRSRRGKVLNRAYFGCLSGVPTLNVTNGCLFQCAYCYARGYSQAPPEGKVQLYVNLPNLLKKELVKKRVFPHWVILNTSSDCFQPHPDILKITYEVMQILLDHGIGISFLTKGLIPGRFFDLFARCPQKILAQVGLVSLSERYWKEYEPGAPPPELRMGNVRKLREIGISPEIRIDPIVPFLTDTENEITRLFQELKAVGVEKVTLSYLHLRPAIQDQLRGELSPTYQKIVEACFRGQGWNVVGSSTKTKLLPRTLRERGYQRIKKVAEEIGIRALICQCKNPDLPGDLCGSGRVGNAIGKKSAIQLPLFPC